MASSPTYMSMERWVNRVALVTGATSGIGKATTIRLYRHGMKVVGIGRREERLQALDAELTGGPGEIYAKKCDVREEAQLQEIFDFIKDKFGGLDVLVNCAGIIRKGGLIDGDIADWVDTINTNTLALCITSKMAIPLMKDRKISGQIIHINSVSGHYVPQVLEGHLNIYPASKFAVRANAESLRLELAKQGVDIKVTDLTPGYVRTEILQPQQLEPDFQDIFSKIIALDAEEVTDSIIYVLSTPRHVNIQELIIHAMHVTDQNEHLVTSVISQPENGIAQRAGTPGKANGVRNGVNIVNETNTPNTDTVINMDPRPAPVMRRARTLEEVIEQLQVVNEELPEEPMEVIAIPAEGAAAVVRENVPDVVVAGSSQGTQNGQEDKEKSNKNRRKSPCKKDKNKRKENGAKAI